MSERTESNGLISNGAAHLLGCLEYLITIASGVKIHNACTLEYEINVHVRLLIFGKFSHLYALIPACTFINFWEIVLDQDQNIEIAVILVHLSTYVE